MPENAEFISDETIEIAEQMDAFQKIRLGFILDGVQYHMVRSDPKRQGIWVVKIETEENNND